MSLSNYPPGVTGNEFPITGPLEEWSEIVGCERCMCERMMDCWWHPDEGAWATCPKCGIEIQLPDPREPDPDQAYEEWRDLQWEAEQHG